MDLKELREKFHEKDADFSSHFHNTDKKTGEKRVSWSKTITIWIITLIFLGVFVGGVIGSLNNSTADPDYITPNPAPTVKNTSDPVNTTDEPEPSTTSSSLVNPTEVSNILSKYDYDYDDKIGTTEFTYWAMDAGMTDDETYTFAAIFVKYDLNSDNYLDENELDYFFSAQ